MKALNESDAVYITIPANDDQQHCASFTRRECREFAAPLFFMIGFGVILLIAGLFFIFAKH